MRHVALACEHDPSMRHIEAPPPQTRGLQRVEHPYACEPFEDGQIRYLRSRYVRGEIDVDDFEQGVEAVLVAGRAQTGVVIVFR